MMRTLDFSPLFRSAVGFDRMADLLDNAARVEQSKPSYPPYNIELLGENNYRITMAVAGFAESDIDITSEQGKLIVVGRKAKDDATKFLHKGIASREFERSFQLADHVNVTDAKLENGLLHIVLVREIPEAMKPKKIAISNGSANTSVADAA